ncbi:hypothetical protein Leryth_020667 [Lithospermum erythrorhizon]|nr:hypothetical protein Leryth_020667 [Lithospermum erythrorhizon]
MANTPSIVSMPTREMSVDFSKMEEGRSRFDEHMPIFSPPSIFQKIIAELVGTYILIFAGCGSALVDRDHPLWGLVLVALIYALGHVSRARFNPAVTIAFATVAKFPLVQVPIYVVTQLLGSTLACLTLRVLFHNQGDILPTLTQYKSATSDLEAIAWEYMWSCLR